MTKRPAARAARPSAKGPQAQPSAKPVRIIPTTPTVGIALGGGAARGIAHIPMLETLDELGIRPAVVAGTSIGSIFGAAYAAGLSGRDIRDYTRALFSKRGELARRVATRWPGSILSLWNPMTPAMFNPETLLEIVMPETLPLDFSGLAMPLLVVATDFYAREQIVLDSGPLIPAIAASSSLPALLKPVMLDNRVLIDGGFVNPTPFDVIRPHAQITVAIDVTANKAVSPTRSGMPNSLDAWIGAAQIALKSIVQEKLRSQAPDVLIRPEVGAFATLDFYKVDQILKAGEACREQLKRAIDQAVATASAEI